MNDSLKTWWRSRTLREQRLLLVMFGLASVVLLWLLILRPLGDGLSRARERYADAALALAEARAQARLIAQLESNGPAGLSEPIDSLISRSATEAGFPVAQLNRESENQASLTLASVRPQAFFGWLAQMESGGGLIVERLNVATNSDRTLSVQVTFRARGR
jgi:general secretion pathway protein M